MRHTAAPIGLHAAGAVLLALLFSAPSGAGMEGASGILDGMKFTGTAVTAGNEQSGRGEEVFFENGRIRASVLDERRFGGGVYTSTEIAGMITFEAECTAEPNECIKWAGTVRRDGIDIVYVWYKGRRVHREYRFRGTLLNEPEHGAGTSRPEERSGAPPPDG